MNAVDRYRSMVEAYHDQRDRIHGPQNMDQRWNAASAARFKADPHRELNETLRTLAGYVDADDVLVDVGGGAGRMSLPMALRCREVINVDTSSEMLKNFTESATEAGIDNARQVHGGWLEVPGIEGDVVLCAHVIYFVAEIAQFIQKLQAAARRRVVIDISSPVPPNRTAHFFSLVYGEEQALAPGHPQLLPVLWELGVLPDVRVLSLPSQVQSEITNREAAIQQALEGPWLAQKDRERAREIIESKFDDLFVEEDGAITPLWRPNSREMFITWETS